MKTVRSNDDWAVCPSGTFERIRGQLPAETRERSMRPFVSAAVIGGVVAAMFFGLSLLGNKDANTNTDSRSMLCGEVISLLPDYIAKKTDSETTKAIAEHLSYCVVCGDRYEELLQEAAVASNDATNNTTVSAAPLAASLF